MRKELIVLLVILGVFLAIGCADNGNEATNETGTPVAAETPASDQEPDAITVSAAASLTEAFTDMESKFETENPDIDVNLAPSLFLHSEKACNSFLSLIP